MKKGFLPVLIPAVLMILSGCNPFTTNVFSSFDKYEMPSLTDADDLIGARNDDDFYDNRKDNPEDKATVLETLADVYMDSSEDVEDQQYAAVMAADVHLKTSDTEEVMESLNSLVADAASGEEVYNEDDGDQPEVFFRTLFGEPPSGVSTSTYKAQVLIQLDAFYEAATPLEVYGETREAGAPIPPDINAGDTATKALMAGNTRAIIFYQDSATPMDDLAEYLATPKDASGNLPPGLNYVGTMPDFDQPTDILINPDPASPRYGSTGLKTVVNDGLDIDDLMS
jgi:hypothetical protein